MSARTRYLSFLMLCFLFTTNGCLQLQPTSVSPASFPIMVRVQAKDTGQDIEGAEVAIEVTGQAPAKGVTVAGGMARIFIDISFVNKPGRLIIEATNYRKRVEEIDLIKDALPTVILLEPLSTPIAPPPPIAHQTPQNNEKPTEIAQVSTETPTRVSTSAPVYPPTPVPPTDTPIPTETPTATTIPQPMPSSTATANSTPTAKATPSPKPSPATVSGRLAIPLKLGNEFRVYLADITTGITDNSPVIVNAKQPLFNNGGQSIIVVELGGVCAGVCRFDRNGQTPQRLNERNLAHWPVLSPDGGTQLIFADLNLDNGKLLRQNSQGVAFNDPGFVELRANNITLVGRNLVWTEDNRLIFRECAYWLGQSGTCGIWVTDADNPNPQRILPTLDFPMDAKNGSLVYLSNADGDWDLYLIPLTGGSPTNLTDNGVNLQDGLATFSPDGRTIAYISNESGAWAVWTVSLSNSEKRQWFAIDPQFGTIDLDTWAEDRMSWSQ